MASRTARKRYRRRESRLKATANPIVERWGWREPAPAIFGDLALVRQAIRESWDIPRATRKHLTDAICHVALSHDGPREYDCLRDELAIRAIRVVIDMVAANQIIETYLFGPGHPGWTAHRRYLLRNKGPVWRRAYGKPPAALWPTDEPVRPIDAPESEFVPRSANLSAAAGG